jgi:hypothetical protein
VAPRPHLRAQYRRTGTHPQEMPVNHIRPLTVRSPVAAQTFLPFLFEIIVGIRNIFSTIFLIDQFIEKKSMSN